MSIAQVEQLVVEAIGLQRRLLQANAEAQRQMDAQRLARIWKCSEMAADRHYRRTALRMELVARS